MVSEVRCSFVYRGSLDAGRVECYWVVVGLERECTIYIVAQYKNPAKEFKTCEYLPF